jgi:hypothetical protein
MKTAYEKWLLMQVNNDTEPSIALANILWGECYKGNKMAFDLVNKVGHIQWSMNTFYEAALMILNDKL